MLPDPPLSSSPALADPVLINSVLTNPVVKFLHANVGLEPESLGVRVIGYCLNDLAREFPGRSNAAIALSAQHDAEVFSRVVAHFSVNESWLFRNPEQFAQLRVFAQTRTRPLKVLSLPCACGEEPASIAITLQEAGVPLGDFCIVAGDLDGEALTKARKGSFPLSAFRGAIPDSRWFEQHDQHYILSPSLLARIEYRQLNVLDPGLFSGLLHAELFDVIFCRNLLIYLHPEARNQVLQLLRRIAAPGALVCTGTAEPVLNFDAAVKSIALTTPPMSPSSIAAASRNSSAAQPKFTPTISPATDMLASSAAEVSTPEPNTAGVWKTRLATIEQIANDGNLNSACARLDQLLQETPTYAEAWYLRGVLASAQNDLARAEMALERAAYLDPSHAATLRLRAELARRVGDNDHADRLRARLKRREGGA